MATAQRYTPWYASACLLPSRSFYTNLRSVGVSAVTGEGMDEFLQVGCGASPG